MNTKKSAPPQTPRFKDVSRFTRWISRLDELDEGLDPDRRKNKWLFFLGFFFLFFALSLILFPAGKFRQEKLSGPELSAEQPVYQSPASSPFEMSTDSFENLLKRLIDETSH